MSKQKPTIANFIGKKAIYDSDGQFIWAVDENDGMQKLADLRGWGAIQNLFMLPNGKLPPTKHKQAEKFQDDLGEWIAQAINEKLERERPNYIPSIEYGQIFKCDGYGYIFNQNRDTTKSGNLNTYQSIIAIEPLK